MREPPVQFVCCLSHRLFIFRCCWRLWSLRKHERIFCSNKSHICEKVDLLEDHLDPHSAGDAWPFALVATDRGERAPSARHFLLRRGATFPAHKPGGTAIRLRAIDWEDLDR